MPSKRFSILDRIRSFQYAFRGIIHLFWDEHNAWIHALATIAVITLGLALKISGTEWIAILIAIALVFITELINSSIESMVDLMHPEHSPKAGKIKDLAAASVLVASILAVIIAMIIFLPKFFN